MNADPAERAADAAGEHLTFLEDLEAEEAAHRAWKAHHEGGHAAAVFALAGRLLTADIVERPTFGGHVVWYLDNDGGAASIDDVVITMAGGIAAKRHAPWHHDGAEGDREEIERDLIAIATTADARRILHEHCRQRARAIVDEHWDVVQAIAAALLKRERMNDAEIAAVISDVVAARNFDTARQAVKRAAWREVEARGAVAPPFAPFNRNNPDALPAH